MALHHHCLPLTPFTPSLPTPLNHETPVIESNKDTVRDTYRSLEELTQYKNHCYVNIKAVKKRFNSEKSPCDRYSETARLTEEIVDLRNENRTKSCIKQTLLENDNTRQKPPVPNRSDFKLPNKYVQSSADHSANNPYISTSN